MLVISFIERIPELRSEVELLTIVLILSVPTCAHSLVVTGVHGKAFAITLHVLTQPPQSDRERCCP